MLVTLRIAGFGGGTLFVVDPTAGPPTALVSGLGVLAGVAAHEADGAVWMSELTDLVRVPVDDPAGWTRHHPFDPRLFADNLVCAGNELLFPYYRVVSRIEAMTLRTPILARLAYRLARLLPASWFGSAAPGQAPDRFDQPCFGRFDPTTGRITSARLEAHREGFDGHCAHVEAAGDHLVFINYLAREVLVATPSR